MTPDQLIFLIENLFEPIVFLPTTVYLLIADLLYWFTNIFLPMLSA